MYVMALNYVVNNQGPEQPTYNFYDSTLVCLEGAGEPIYQVVAEYNNVLEGNRRMVMGRSSAAGICLTFQVNSPRPAVLYVNDQAYDIFLMPGDTSLVGTIVPQHKDTISWEDTIYFSGKAEKICQYYQSRTQKLGDDHIRARGYLDADTLVNRYFQRLDSLAAKELVFLVEHEVFSALPDWFVASEKNDILYQKAYLKLARAFNRELSGVDLDLVTLDNAGAVFSYYYYLYLETYFKSQIHRSLTYVPSWGEVLERQLKLADSLLTGDQHDVCLARLLFQQLNQQEEGLRFVGELIEEYQPAFNRQKYFRFIKIQWEERVRELVR